VPSRTEDKNVTTYDFVHLVLLAFDGTIQGRTKLQKTVYFVGALTDKLPNLGYGPYYYGPYSGEVTAAVHELRGLGFLQQTTASAGAVDPQGFEVARYDYCLTPEGRQIAQEKAEQYPDEWKRIQEAARRLRAIPDSDYVKLSIAAKMFYVLGLGEKGAGTVRDLVEMTPRLGWTVSTDQMQEAARFLKSLGLIRLEEAT
jgi:uncharacterized protein YwgA